MNRQYIVFLSIAVLMMIVADHFLSPIIAPQPQSQPEIRVDEPVTRALPQDQDTGLSGDGDAASVHDFAPPRLFSAVDPLSPGDAEPQEPEHEDEARPVLPTWKRNAVAFDPEMTGPRIVVIIDDMGVDRKHTLQTMDLPGPLTFAFLPYASALKEQTEYARSRGHELMVHMPMEPMKGSLDAGPSVLRVDVDEAAFMDVLAGNLSAFDGYVGINNHMGSRMTQDRDGMRRVMAELKRRGLLFVDSKTISTSVAADEARMAGIAYAERDIFLDHEDTPEFINAALLRAERDARKNGVAIVIGHPRKHTVEALRAWLPTLAGQGISIAPVSAVVIVDEGAASGD